MWQERLAVVGDLDRLMAIRAVVRENRLDDPSAVTQVDYHWYIAERLLWVAVEGDMILGFSASDPRDGSIWALFVDPVHEGRGVGRGLLARACADLAKAGFRVARLRTGSGTRAERFYGLSGWRRVGTDENGEAFMERSLDLSYGPSQSSTP